MAPHPLWIEPSEWLGNAPEGFLHLVSPQPAMRLHSQLDGVGVSRANKIDGREPLLINPEDAAVRNIADGDVVLISKARGRCLAGACLTGDIMRGVAALATGAWYAPAEPGSPGSLELHGNPNVLTTNRPTSTLSHGPAQHTALVKVERAPLTSQRQMVHKSAPLVVRTAKQKEPG